ncbi:MAG: DUF484 family protein [Gammaproteobacteria bacterium]|nr:DUF484 family protein [Gammaproteobacteria bacterium]
MTRQTKKSEPIEGSINEEQVLDFLRTHPDLLRRHNDVLSALDIPHDSGDAISLVEYQARILQNKNRELSTRLEHLLWIARDNDRLAEQMHRFTLEMLSANDLEEALVALRDGLRQDFKADVVQVILIADKAPTDTIPVLAPDDTATEALQAHFSHDTPVLGELDSERLQLVFGEQATDIRSAAVVPLDEPPVLGYIAIGSRDPNRYHIEQGTIFLGHLGALVSRILRRALEP